MKTDSKLATQQLNIRVPEETHRQLKALAAMNGQTLQEFVGHSLNVLVGREPNEPDTPESVAEKMKVVAKINNAAGAKSPLQDRLERFK